MWNIVVRIWLYHFIISFQFFEALQIEYKMHIFKCTYTHTKPEGICTWAISVHLTHLCVYTVYFAEIHTHSPFCIKMAKYEIISLKEFEKEKNCVHHESKSWKEEKNLYFIESSKHFHPIREIEWIEHRRALHLSLSWGNRLAITTQYNRTNHFKIM